MSRVAKKSNKIGNLNIGGHVYKVKHMKDVNKKDGRMLLGLHDVKEQTIMVDIDLQKSRKVETLLHEVLHVIYTNTGCDHDERAIDALSNGLMQLGVGNFIWDKVKRV
tara:strand:- start:573 stop:896 length:324 start_codon:yes stop_codon:yes gene_type:complete